MMTPGPASTSPLNVTWLSSVGQHEVNRINRHYFPEGNPGVMMQQMAFAKKYGLNYSPYLRQAGKVYGLWRYYQASPNGGSPEPVAEAVTFIKKERRLTAGLPFIIIGTIIGVTMFMMGRKSTTAEKPILSHLPRELTRLQHAES